MTGGKMSDDRIVRYADLRPCFDAFIDTRTPGSDQKENFTIIGPGVSENPNQYVHIAEPHGFNIGGARQPPGCTNSQHSHETVEVFFVHSGTWSFNVGENGEDAQITLNPGDLISIPTHVFRGFENIGKSVGYLWAVLGGDDPGHVLWAPKVFEMAADYGLVLLENGSLIDSNKGEEIPTDLAVMPVTTSAQVAALQRFDAEQLRACCVLAGEATPAITVDGEYVRQLIGPNAKLNWQHGFTLEHINLQPSRSVKEHVAHGADVVFVQSGTLSLRVDRAVWRLGAGDTATVPRGCMRAFSNELGSDVAFLRVQGGLAAQ